MRSQPSVLIDLTDDDEPEVGSTDTIPMPPNTEQSAADDSSTPVTRSPHLPASKGGAGTIATATTSNSMASIILINDNGEPPAEAFQQSKKKKRRLERRSVSFASCVIVHGIGDSDCNGDSADESSNNSHDTNNTATDSDSDDETKRASWYSVDELQAMRQDAIQTVVQVTRQRRLCMDIYGLENMFHPFAKQRKLLKRSLKAATTMTVPPSAALYHQMTTPSRRRARQMALAHERNVHRMWGR